MLLAALHFGLCSDDAQLGKFPGWTRAETLNRLYLDAPNAALLAWDPASARSYVAASFTDTQTLFWRAEFTPRGYSTADTVFAQLLDAGTVQINLSMTQARQIKIARGTTVLATSVDGLVANRPVLLECQARIADSGGFVTLRVNGSTFVAVDGVDTQATTHPSVNALRLSNWSNVDDYGGYAAWRKVLVWDTGGTSFNDWLGARELFLRHPNGDGEVLQWTPSAGTAHYALLDETVSNEGADGVSAAGSGLNDLLQLEDLPASVSAIDAVLLLADALGAAGENLKLGWRIGGVEYPGTAQAVATASYQYRQRVDATHPATGLAWTPGEFNTAQVLLEGA